VGRSARNNRLDFVGDPDVPDPGFFKTILYLLLRFPLIFLAAILLTYFSTALCLSVCAYLPVFWDLSPEIKH